MECQMSRKFLKPVALVAAALIPLSGASLASDASVSVRDNNMTEEVSEYYLAEDFVLRPSNTTSNQTPGHASHSSHSSHASHASHSSHSSSGY